jgi:hypothetical protein
MMAVFRRLRLERALDVPLLRVPNAADRNTGYFIAE